MLTNRLLAPIAIQDNKNNVIDVDLGAFLRRVLLFPTYILQSIWLEDLALLTRAFDPEGLAQLFEVGALKVYCESYTIAETGRARADLNFSDNNKRLPLGSYSFSVIRAHEPDRIVQEQLNRLPSKLAEKATPHLLTIKPQEFSSLVFEGFYGDLRRNEKVIQSAIELGLQRQGIKPKRLQVTVEEVDKEDFRVANNLAAEYGLSERTAHEVVGRALIAIAGLNYRIVEMMTHSALSGITEEDMPLMRDKLGFVANFIQPNNNNERQFDRIANIVDLPIPLIGETKIDAEKLLKIRDSDECRAFRDWLSKTDSLSDKELKERLTGFNARLRATLNSKRTKKIRFLVSNGLSFLPGVGSIVGLVASAIDSFVLDRLAPKDAIVSFLSENYRSLLESTVLHKPKKR